MLNSLFDAMASFTQPQWQAPLFAYPFAGAAHGASGKFIRNKYVGDAGSLKYKLFIPSNYSDSPIPLIVMLHGGGQDADDFALGTGMNDLAEQFGCMVAYPEQSRDANWSRCWNWFDQARHRTGGGEPALIAGLTRKIMDKYTIDTARVYVAGMSSGAAMAVILGRTHSDLFSAVGCHSGLAHGSASNHYGAMLAMRDGPSRRTPADAGPMASIPTIAFHGDQDFTVHPANSLDVVQQSVECYTATASDMRALLVSRKESGETGGRRYSRTLYQGPAGNTVAEQWIVHGTGHAWSGGDIRGTYTDRAGPNASKEMLRFFLQQKTKSSQGVPD